MFPTTPKIFALTAATLLFAGATRAQSLDGEVVRNPDDTVTYTIDLDGPPRGQAQLFIGLALAPVPFLFWPYGQVYLDPFVIRPLTPLLPLDHTGKFQHQITVPPGLTLGDAFTIQSVNVDPIGIIQLSTNAIALGQNVVPVPAQPAPFNYTFAYETGGADLRMAGSGEPGSTVEVRIINSEGIRVTETATVGEDGKFFLNVNTAGGITADDDVMVIVDGSMVDKIDLYKFK